MSTTFTAATHTAVSPQVNLNSRNAAEILHLLGLPVEQDGEHPAEDFHGRVLLALALADTTIDEHGLPATTDGRWTTCGRQPGHIAARLANLHEVAAWAIEHNAVVAWS